MIESGFTAFARSHWVIGGVVTSLLAHLSGLQSFEYKKNDFAFLQSCIGIMIAVILLGWTIARGEWVGLLLTIGVLYFEIRSIRRMLKEHERQSIR
jgi:hypothetical protein